MGSVAREGLGGRCKKRAGRNKQCGRERERKQTEAETETGEVLREAGLLTTWSSEGVRGVRRRWGDGSERGVGDRLKREKRAEMSGEEHGCKEGGGGRLEHHSKS